MNRFTAERWAALVEAAPDAMLCVDAGGTVVFANDQTVRLFGYRREELVGRPVELLIPDAARQAPRAPGRVPGRSQAPSDGPGHATVRAPPRWA